MYTLNIVSNGRISIYWLVMTQVELPKIRNIIQWMSEFCRILKEESCQKQKNICYVI